jgi:hypothetical protein
MANRAGTPTAGLLQRMPVRAAAEFRHIGKETDRRWEREDDISLLNPRLVEYRPQETARLVADPILQHNVAVFHSCGGKRGRRDAEGGEGHTARKADSEINGAQARNGAHGSPRHTHRDRSGNEQPLSCSDLTISR